MALNSLSCADVPLSHYSLTLLTYTGWPKKSKPLSRIIIKSY